MSSSRHLDAELKIRIQTLLAEKSITDVAAELKLSRNTIYRWKERKNIGRKSHRPKNGTASLLPIQRDVICELIRLSRWPKRELLPLVSRVFPVFEHVGEAGQRRLWKEVLGTGTLAGVLHDPDPDPDPDPESESESESESEFYRSSFRLGALFVAQEGQAFPPVCVLVAWETVSGALVHRVIEGQASDTTDFLIDLCHEWPFQIEQITIVSTESERFPGLPGKNMGALHKALHSSITQKFKHRWTKQPRLGKQAADRAAPQSTPPVLTFETSPKRSRIILLPPRNLANSPSSIKPLIRSSITSHNTRQRWPRPKWHAAPRQHLTPYEYLDWRWKSGEMNGSVGDEMIRETKAKLRVLLTHPLVMYSKRRQSRIRAVHS